MSKSLYDAIQAERRARQQMLNDEAQRKTDEQQAKVDKCVLPFLPSYPRSFAYTRLTAAFLLLQVRPQPPQRARLGRGRGDLVRREAPVPPARPEDRARRRPCRCVTFLLLYLVRVGFREGPR